MTQLHIHLWDQRNKEYVLTKARPTGGKAGKGRNKTSTVQVWYGGQFVVKHIRYELRNPESYRAAIKKAVIYVLGQKEGVKRFNELFTTKKEANGKND